MPHPLSDAASFLGSLFPLELARRPDLFCHLRPPQQKGRTPPYGLNAMSRSMVPGAADYQLDQREVPGFGSTAYPGDPAIDAHFDVPNAQTPKCPSGQSWDHTSGMPAYNTASGDLGVNQYAQLPDGSYVVHYPAQNYKYLSSTSRGLTGSRPSRRIPRQRRYPQRFPSPRQRSSRYGAPVVECHEPITAGLLARAFVNDEVQGFNVSLILHHI